MRKKRPASSRKQSVEKPMLAARARKQRFAGNVLQYKG